MKRKREEISEEAKNELKPGFPEHITSRNRIIFNQTFRSKKNKTEI